MSPGLETVLLGLLPCAVLDATGAVVGASPSFARRLGLPEGEIPGVDLLPALRGRIAGQEPAWSAEHGQDIALRAGRLALRPYGPPETRRVLALLVPEAGPELDELAALSARTRHEVNNVLMSLMGNAELLRDLPGLPETARARIDRIFADCGRIRDEVAGLSRAKDLQRHAAARAAEDEA